MLLSTATPGQTYRFGHTPVKADPTVQEVTQVSPRTVPSTKTGETLPAGHNGAARVVDCTFEPL